MYFVGVDPDMQKTSVAVVDHLGKVAGVWCVRARKKATEHAGSLEMVNSVAEFFRSEPLPDGILAAAVEGQEISYTARAGKNPRSVAFLGPISGAMLAVLRLIFPGMEEDLLLFPTPQQWKGSVPKVVHQARIYNKLGWTAKLSGNTKSKDAYMIPSPPKDIVGEEDISRAEWKHVGDAIGLALWAKERYELLVRRGKMPQVSGYGQEVPAFKVAGVQAANANYALAAPSPNPPGAATPEQGDPAHDGCSNHEGSAGGGCGCSPQPVAEVR